MFCAYTRPRYQVSVYRTIGPLVIALLCQNISVTVLSKRITDVTNRSFYKVK